MGVLNRAVLAVIFALGIAIALLSVASARLGPAVDSMRTVQSLDGTSVNTQIALSFTDRMNPKAVERAFRISPRTRGDFNWAGNTLLFSPREGLAYGTQYRV